MSRGFLDRMSAGVSDRGCHVGSRSHLTSAEYRRETFCKVVWNLPSSEAEFAVKVPQVFRHVTCGFVGAVISGCYTRAWWWLRRMRFVRVWGTRGMPGRDCSGSVRVLLRMRAYTLPGVRTPRPAPGERRVHAGLRTRSGVSWTGRPAGWWPSGEPLLLLHLGRRLWQWRGHVWERLRPQWSFRGGHRRQHPQSQGSPMWFSWVYNPLVITIFNHYPLALKRWFFM